jgi:serine/threonine protein kinase
LTLAPEETLSDGRYRLERVLGTGGMASVWLAHDQRLGRPVAVKVISDLLAVDQQWLHRFEREARAAASVSHPHIVQVFDYSVHGNQPYLVMEYVPGGSLADRLSASPPSAQVLDVEALAQALLDALAHIHDVGIVHRDVKPGNILLGTDGRARLTDFGIAQPDDATQLTQTGLVLGTLKYLAPEVLQGKPATVASDLYAAGVVLREAAAADPRPALANLISALTGPAPEQRPTSARAALELLGDTATRDGRERTAATHALDSTTATQVAQPASLQAAARAQKASSSAHQRARVAGAEIRKHRISPRLLLAGLTTALVLLIIVLAASSGGGNNSAKTSATGAPPAIPAPSAPLQQQLQALGQIVNHAARR